LGVDGHGGTPYSLGVSPLLTRRDILRAFAASAALPVQGLRAASRRRRVGIVGGGMAGVSLAWLLDGACDVILLEASDSIGGNVQSVEVDLDGSRFAVDIGAQYFHPVLYPAYTALLEHLGLGDPASSEPRFTRAFPASITLTAGLQSTPRFVSPALPERWWPFFAPWNSAGIWAFGLGFFAAKLREELNQPWDLTLEEWLPTLGLSEEQWEGMLLPWAASLFSGSVEQARGVSARAAMIFAAKALPPNLFDPILYYVLTSGMIEVLSRMIAQCSNVTILTGARVLDVSRGPANGFTLRSARRTVHVDDLVFASSGPPTARLVTGLPGAAPQSAALSSMEFHDARLALHTDPLYASTDPNSRSFLNCDVQGDFCEASMWLASVVSAPSATAAKVWKSWITHRERPKQVLYETTFTHMLPTPATLQAQDGLGSLQGQNGLWFAGGYLYPYDSQETALLSALRVALGLHVTSARSQMLLAAL
jgi:predicted NAD/FAD-binding protein